MARKAWEVGWWSPNMSAVGDLFVAGASVATQAPTGQGGAGSLYLVTLAQVEDSDRDRVTPIRIVGATHVGALSASGEGVDGVWYKERIHVGMQTADGTVLIEETLWDNPSENYMWERTRMALGVLTNANNEANVSLFETEMPYWSQFDIRVSRRIEPPEVLCYTIQTDPGDIRLVGGRVRVWGWSRMLVAR